MEHSPRTHYSKRGGRGGVGAREEERELEIIRTELELFESWKTSRDRWKCCKKNIIRQSRREHHINILQVENCGGLEQVGERDEVNVNCSE